MTMRCFPLTLALLTCSWLAGARSATELVIQTDQPGARISPSMWGIFFEDINLGADGGLYAELVKNRSFEFPDPLMGWQALSNPAGAGTIEVREDNPLTPANPHYLRLRVTEPGQGWGVANEGFRGMGLRRGANYRFSIQARQAGGGSPRLRIELASATGSRLAVSILDHFGNTWQTRTALLRAGATDAKAQLRLVMEGTGTLDLDMVSLFPEHTWKDRPNGLRADLVQLLAELKPGFVRFPGGCIVEGHWLTNRYQWKTTIGPVAERKLIMNRWNDEFKHRPTPDYYQSFGLGFFEFFQLCEDIGAAPLPILNCGMACQFNSGELAPVDQLEPYIQDALDLIEFANGPASSRWGAPRAAMGHPQPFHLTMLGVGNEQWGSQYFERYERFATALRAQHPEIKLVAGAGPSPADERFNLAWARLRELKADIVDEHCYDKPAWFLDHANRYDQYDRNGPKVFMGEYAAQSVQTVSPDNRNDWGCALAEAAYMTGLERNADVVVMSSYAPLLAHVDGWQWTPDLIWFDNRRAFASPSYYVQQLFSRNRGDFVLPTRLTGVGATPRLYASASRDQAHGEIILKFVNATGEDQRVNVNLAGTGRVTGKARVTVLTAAELGQENTLDHPLRVAPQTRTVKPEGPQFEQTFLRYSVTVLRIKAP